MPHVLVIDDEKDIREVISEYLTKNGCEVSIASNGKEAFHIINESIPDVVITDLIMPEKEGIETILELKKNFKDVKIIAMSGGGIIGADSYLSIAEKLGIHKAFAKPFRINELLNAVTDIS